MPSAAPYRPASTWPVRSTALTLFDQSRGGHEVPLRAHTQPYFDLIRTEVFERSRAERRRLAAIDPVHLASTIAGSTVFFVAAMPLLVPDAGLNPLAPERLAAHEAELLEIVRRLLGTGAQ